MQKVNYSRGDTATTTVPKTSDNLIDNDGEPHDLEDHSVAIKSTKSITHTHRLEFKTYPKIHYNTISLSTTY